MQWLLNLRNWRMKFRASFGVCIAILFFVCNTSRAQEEITLQQVLTMALEKNYDVLLARNISEAAATDDRYAFGVFLPQIDATAGTVWNSNRQELRFADETRNNKGKAESNSVTASAQLVWT